MKATETLYNVGQSLWLDNITRDLLTSGTLKRYIDTLSITGLTSNPTIFDHAISKSTAYDHDIRAMTRSGVAREDFLKEYEGEELDPNWSRRVVRLSRRGWKEFATDEREKVRDLRTEIQTLAQTVRYHRKATPKDSRRRPLTPLSSGVQRILPSR